MRNDSAYRTFLLNECPTSNHRKCKIMYVDKARTIKQYCMCPCHSHVKPFTREPEPVVGIDALVLRSVRGQTF